jgi:hypothetical protein
MSRSFFMRLAPIAIAAILGACADSTAPTRSIAATPAQFGKTVDSAQVGGGGGGGGGGGVATPCGTLSTAINTVFIQVYTTRIGIGVNGSTTNCGSRNLAFEVDVTDQNTDPACAVNMPHFIAPKNTAPGATTNWVVNSTLVRCINQVHTFDVRLWDTKTGETLATTTVSAFL